MGRQGRPGAPCGRADRRRDEGGEDRRRRRGVPSGLRGRCREGDAPFPAGHRVGLVPWWLTRWRVRGALAHWAPLRAARLAMLILGALVLVPAFSRFVAEGHGPPPPLAPPPPLVVGGPFPH